MASPGFRSFLSRTPACLQDLITNGMHSFQPTAAHSSAWVAPCLRQTVSTKSPPALPSRNPSGRSLISGFTALTDFFAFRAGLAFMVLGFGAAFFFVGCFLIAGLVCAGGSELAGAATLTALTKLAAVSGVMLASVLGMTRYPCVAFSAQGRITQYQATRDAKARQIENSKPQNLRI